MQHRASVIAAAGGGYSERAGLRVGFLAGGGAEPRCGVDPWKPRALTLEQRGQSEDLDVRRLLERPFPPGGGEGCGEVREPKARAGTTSPSPALARRVPSLSARKGKEGDFASLTPALRG